MRSRVIFRIGLTSILILSRPPCATDFPRYEVCHGLTSILRTLTSYTYSGHPREVIESNPFPQCP